MISDAAFAAGMHALCVAYDREPTEDLLNVYRGVIAPQLTDDEWRVAVSETLSTWRSTRLPPPAMLLEAKRREREAAEVAAANEAFRAVDRSAVEMGGGQRRRVHYVIARDLGPEVAEAFEAVGGHEAFEEDDRGRRYVMRQFTAALRAAWARRAAIGLPEPMEELGLGRRR